MPRHRASETGAAGESAADVSKKPASSGSGGDSETVAPTRSARVNTAAKGAALERRVAELLRHEGFKNVRTNVRIRDKNRNLSEIDVIGTNRSWFTSFLPSSLTECPFQRTVYVECKHYGEHRLVPLSDVAKFKSVLELNDFPIRQGLFVTTTRFVPRATTIGIRTVDGTQLKLWEAKIKRRQRVFRIVKIIFLLVASTMAFGVAWLRLIRTRLKRNPNAYPVLRVSNEGKIPTSPRPEVDLVVLRHSKALNLTLAARLVQPGELGHLGELRGDSLCLISRNADPNEAITSYTDFRRGAKFVLPISPILPFPLRNPNRFFGASIGFQYPLWMTVPGLGKEFLSQILSRLPVKR